MKLLRCMHTRWQNDGKILFSRCLYDSFCWSLNLLWTWSTNMMCFWMNFCSVWVSNAIHLWWRNWTTDRKVKLNFRCYFPWACIPLGSIQDQWQWPRIEEGNLTFSWGLKPLLWMAGVNTSNQEQMFGFLTWPFPFHGNVEDSGSDSACMPYSKWPGSTLVVLPFWDFYVKVQRLCENRYALRHFLSFFPGTLSQIT